MRYRDVEDLLAERGVDVFYETIRWWILKFGPLYAKPLKQRRQGLRVVAFDGKTLCGSFNHFADRKAAHLVTTFPTDSTLILGHIEIDDKSNEVPAVQRLLAALVLAGSVVTVDAQHGQKKFHTAARHGRHLGLPSGN